MIGRWTVSLMALMMVSAATADVAVQAFLPERGFYWNPDQPGRGYAIEVQDRTVFMTIYTYTEETDPAARVPLWFSVSGNLSANQSGQALTYNLDTELFYSAEGQCLDCDFVDPVTEATGRPTRLSFDSPIHGFLTVGTEEIELFRFWYSESITNPLLALFGQWAVVVDYSDADDTILPFDGDILEVGFLGTSDGQNVAQGFRGATDVVVAGAYDANQDFFVIVVAETTNLYLAYYFPGARFGTDAFDGLAERYVPGNNLTGAGFPAYGHRISDRTFAENQLAKSGKSKPLDSGTAAIKPQRRAQQTDMPKWLDLDALNLMRAKLEAQVQRHTR